MKVLYKASFIMVFVSLVTMLSYSQNNIKSPDDCDYCDAEGGCFMKIDGVEFSEISNLDTDCDEGYSDYTSLTGTVTPGVTYTLTVFSENYLSNNDYGVWIDWDQDCTFDSDELVVDEVNNGQAEHNWDVFVPLTATPGITTMRIRLKSSGSNSGSPCGSTTFGEVEDYSIDVIPPAFGILEGYVTDMITGDALEGVNVNYGGYFPTVTDEDGFYQYEVAYAGDWELTAELDGFNLFSDDITIVDAETLVYDIELTRPVIDVDPSSLSVTLELDDQSTEMLILSNIGTGEMDWEADLDVISDEINDDWISIDIDEGYLDVAGEQNITVSFDATGLILGNIYYAQITYTSDPDSDPFVTDIEMVVGSLAVGSIQGNVFLEGIAPYNIGNVEELKIETGPYFTYPDADGNYNMTTYPGTYDVTATLYGYTPQTITDVIVPEGTDVLTQDFSMPCLYGRFFGVITDNETGDVIENAIVGVMDTDFEATTNADGEYEIIIEAGTYDILANHDTYAPNVSENQSVDAQSDSEVDLTLQYKCNYCTPSAGCYTYIKGVKFKTISNTNTGCSGGYKDYTDLVTSVWPDSTYTLTIHTQTASADVDYTVWIDWDRDCVFEDEEEVVCMPNSGELVKYFDIYVPLDVTPGLSTMRVRNKLNGSACASACGSTTYGETEDYSINLLPIITGTLEGNVSDLATGDPLEGALVMVNNALPIYTDELGDYSAEVYIGEWEVTCDMLSYNIDTVDVTIIEDEITTQDFELTHPTFDIDPESVAVELENGSTSDEVINLSNNGNGPIDWSAAIVLSNKGNTKDFLDVQFQYPTEMNNGEAGIACDGQYIYTTRWSGAQFHKYGLDGTYIESFTIPGVGFVRDLTYDGTYYYGGPDATYIWKMDLENQEMIEQIATPVKVRALAWDFDEEVFYAASTADSITAFDKFGNYVDSWDVGPVGVNYYGFAYDNYSEGGPYLWGYAPVGDDNNELIQMELPTGDETGYKINIADKITGAVTKNCAGLFTRPNIINGKWTLMGLIQDEWIWGLELADFDSWISIDIDQGHLEADEEVDMTVHLAPNDLLPGAHEANIYITSVPDALAGPIPVTLTIPGLVTPTNLEATLNCLDVDLTWIMSAGGDPDGWNVYRDEELIDFVTEEMAYTDPQVPGDYSYYVTAVFGGEESGPTETVDITVVVPPLLAPDPFALIAFDPTLHNYTFGWALPQSCIDPLGYNIYRSDSLLNQDGLLTDLSYTDENVCEGSYMYYVRAVYEYGESDKSTQIPVNVTDNPCDTYSIFFEVKSLGGVVLEDAEVDLDGTIQYTDLNGETTFEGLEPADYPYTVTYGNAEPETDVVELVDEDELVEVVFEITSISELEKLGLYIFPNPAKDMVNVTSDNDMIKSVKILNNAGQFVVKKDVDEYNYQFNVSEFDKGIYFIEIETRKGKTVSKIIVE